MSFDAVLLSSLDFTHTIEIVIETVTSTHDLLLNNQSNIICKYTYFPVIQQQSMCRSHRLNNDLYCMGKIEKTQQHRIKAHVRKFKILRPKPGA